jgi:hypothetical protein
MAMSFLYLALATEFLAAIVGTLYWFKARTKATLYFSLFIQLDFVKSVIGLILAMNGIENLRFYNVFGALPCVLDSCTSCELSNHSFPLFICLFTGCTIHGATIQIFSGSHRFFLVE